MTTERRASSPAPFLALGGVLVVGWFFLGGRGADYVYLLVTALAAGAAWLGAKSAAPGNRTAARLLAGGLTSAALGDALWFAIDWRGGDPDPSVADVFYLAGYGLLAAAVMLLLLPLRGRRRAFDADTVIDVLTVVTVSLLALWQLAIHEQVADTSLAGLFRQSELVYPLVDAVLLGLVVRAATDRPARQALGATFGIGVLAWLAGDFSYLLRGDSPRVVDALAASWMVGSLLLAATTIRLARTDAVTQEPSDRATAVTRLVLAGAPLAVPPLLVVVETATGRTPQVWSLVAGLLVLVALSLARTDRLLRSEQQVRTELARARDNALEVSRAKSHFLASITHEVRSPMNGVLGLSRLLEASGLDAEQQQYTDGIRRAGESLMVLLNEVLDFAKFENGVMALDTVDFDVVEVVEEVAEMVAEQAHHHGLELLAHCAADLPRSLNGDPVKLRQVLLNFASNAVKMTSEGEVSITADVGERTDGGVVLRLEVRDTGPGIAAADQHRLFQAFTQVDRHAGRAASGTGLGLAIARSLVTAMGGDLGVVSRPGRGATFWATVPVGVARQQQVVLTRPSRARPGSRVLVVDDHPGSREVLATHLSTWDLDVTCCTNGPAAVVAMQRAAAAGTPYSLLLVDQRMPRMDGLEVVRRVRADPALAATPAVLLTSGPPARQAELVELGLEVTLAKPVQLSRLQGAVQRAMGEPVDRATPTTLVPSGGHPGGRGVVLVVEDSEVNRLVAVGTLRQLGYLTEVAADGREAVEMVAANRYDAVLMDCRMPVMDGFEATIEIRRGERGHRVPIIAVTANAVSGERERCLMVGMDDFLLKPLSRQQLSAVLAHWTAPLPVAAHR